MLLQDTQAVADRLSAVQTYGHFINNEWVEGNSGETIELSNPATRATLAHIQAGDAVDVDRAVNAAYAGLTKWAHSTPNERQALLLALADLLRKRQLDYAMLDTLNNGKTIGEALYHVEMAIGVYEYYAGAAFYKHGELLDFPDASVLVHREPIGVVAAIIPWNVALMFTAFKLAPAIAAGCTMVLKPAESVCVNVLEFFKDAADLLPPGLINVVTGYGQAVGEPLVSHPKVRKVTFTGSRGTARKIIQYASSNIIPQTMELGGKSANIVCADADLNAAAESAVMTTIANKGEICLAGSRVFVHRSVRDEFLEKFVEQLGNVVQGNPIDPTVQLGAQASKIQFDRVNEYIDLGRSEGAVAAAGGGPAKIAGLEDGLFIQPTIFTNVRNDMRIAQEEIFGPVTGVIEWDDEADMIRQVNDSPYGLAGGVWTRNLTQAHRLSRAIETGTVYINRYYNMKPGQPTGGYKQSGFGREYCLETLDHFTVTKSVVINLEEGPIGFFQARPQG